EMEIDLEAPALISNALLKNLFDRLTYLETLTEAHTAELQTLTQVITDQNTTIMSLQTTPTSSSEPKLADPEPFTSNHLHLGNFLAKCHLKFMGEPSKFKDKLSKIYYTGSRLGEPVFSWFQPLLAAAEDKEKPNPPEFVSFEVFAKALMAVYGDPNLAASSV